jgi:hypothetical protein
LTALDLLRAIGAGVVRAPVLAYAVEHLPEARQAEVRAEAVAQAQDIAEPEARARALAGLLPTLPAAERPALAVAALAAAVEFDDAAFWARTVQWTAAELPPDVREAAYTSALVLTSVEAGAEALGALAVFTPASERGPRLAEALRLAARVEDDWGRAFTVSRLAAALTPDLWDEALNAARSIGDAWARADLLVDLSAALPAERSEPVLREAWATARAATAPWPRARALTGVAGRCA